MQLKVNAHLQLERKEMFRIEREDRASCLWINVEGLQRAVAYAQEQEWMKQRGA